MEVNISMPNILVAPIHFEDFSGESFERLVFAYHLRVEWWHSIEWYGQVGSDSGRDIWAARSNDFDQPETLCIQCVNRERLTKAKAFDDITKIISAPRGAPTRIRFVCSSDASAKLRDAVKTFAASKNIDETEVWSGQEFEERLRAYAESLVQRFCQGVVFPDSATDLGDFVRDLPAANDEEIIARLSRVFERPAFKTPFYAESSLGDFKKAISLSIEALNTGICRTNDRTVFAKIHCRYDLTDVMLKKTLDEICDKLNQLRMEYDKLERSGEIEECGSGSHLHLSQRATQVMDDRRRDILDLYRAIYPNLSASLTAFQP
jgi:hypothetical protein